MSTRHGIRVRVPVEDAELYLVEYILNWVIIQHYFYWNPVLQCEAKTRMVFYPAESLYQGKKLLYNQSPLYHAYYEAELDPLILTSLVKSTKVVAPYSAQQPYHPYPSIFSKFADGSTFWKTLPFRHFKTDNRWYPDVSSSPGDSYSTMTSRNTDGVITQETSAKVVWGKPQKQLGPNTPYCAATFTGGYTMVDIGKGLDENGRTPRFKPMAPLSTTLQGQHVCSVKPSDFDTSKFNFAMHLPAFPVIGHGVPGNLTDRVYEHLVLPNVNNIENAGQLKKMKRIIPNLRKALSKHDYKSFAELYLMWKYEYSTTKMDLKAYYAYFQNVAKSSKLEKQMIRVSGPTSNLPFGTTRYTISIPTYSASLLETLGLTPTLSNVWDTLPFTFVADWFVNFGDILQRIHEDGIVSTLKIRYCTISTSVKDTVEIESGPFEGVSVVRSIYYRTCNNAIPTPDIDVVFKNPIRHLADGTALLVALHK